MNDKTRNEREPREQPVGAEDRVGSLIRLAGPREDPPQDRMERVRETVREAWLEQTAQRRVRTRRRVAAVLATAAMLIVAVLAVLNRSSIPTEPTELSASVEAVFGTAWSRSVTGSASE